MENQLSNKKGVSMLNKILVFILGLSLFLRSKVVRLVLKLYFFCMIGGYAVAFAVYAWNFEPRLEKAMERMVQESKISICSSGRSIDDVWKGYRTTGIVGNDKEQIDNKILALKNECTTEGTTRWRGYIIKWTTNPIMIDVQHEVLDTPFVEKSITFSFGKDTIEMSNLGTKYSGGLGDIGMSNLEMDYPEGLDSISYVVMKVNGKKPQLWKWLPFVPSTGKEVLQWIEQK